MLHRRSHFLGAALFGLWAALNVLGVARAEDWRVAFEEDFKAADWAERWELTGSVGPTDGGVLRNAGKELSAWIRQEFKAPCIRIEFQARMESADLAGKVSDLSCLLGPGRGDKKAPTCAIQFGAQNNAVNRITFPGTLPVTCTAPLIEVGKWYQCVAEINGRVASLTIDGKRVLEALLPTKLPRGFVRMYTWTGQAAFRNLKVYTRQNPDPIPAVLKAGETQDLKPWREWSIPRVAAVRASPIPLKRIALHVNSPSRYRGPWPITMGVPFPPETLWDLEAVRVVDEKGDECPAEVRLAATWTKGRAIRWVHLDFQPDLKPEQSVRYFLEFGRDVKRSAVPRPVKVEEDGKGITVDSGVLKIVVSKERGSLIEAAWLDLDRNGTYGADELVVRPEGEKGGHFVTTEGDRYTTTRSDKQYQAVVESAGPMRAVIRTRGWYQNAEGERACTYLNRLYVYRGRPEVRLFSTWVITVDTDKFKFRELGTRFPITLKGRPRALLGTDAAFERPPQVVAENAPAEAVQVTRHHGFTRHGDEKTELRDIGGWVDLNDGVRGLTAAVFDMEKQWPNAIEIRPGEIVFHAFSNACGHDLDFSLDFLKQYWGKETYERLQKGRKSYPSYEDRVFNACGMAKTHEIVLRFHGEEEQVETERFAEAAQRMPVAYAAPEWVCASGAVGIVHPHDPERFPGFEKSVAKRFDEYLDVLDRLTPVYGFYDYGMGAPHHLQPHKTAKGETEYRYDGYRREYDIGYANPIVPWELFVRSGDRRYYRYAVAFSRHCMDAHSHHWTNPRLKKRIGWIVDGAGSWVYGTHHADFTFNNWMEYLLLNYYVAGHERAMDVAVQFGDALYDLYVVKKQPFNYCGLAGLWHGNAALMYRATWEERFRELYDITEKQQLAAWDRESGAFSAYPGGFKPGERFITHRQLWREYGLYHGTLVPGHRPELDESFARLGQWDLRYHGWGERAPYLGSAYSHWAAYQQTRDPRFIKFAQLRLAGGAPTLWGWSGLCALRQQFAWMKLAALPGAEEVQVPVKRSFTRAERTPLFLLHERGKQTSLTTGQFLRVHDPKGNDVTAKVVRRDKPFRATVLRIPAEAASGVYRVDVTDRSKDPWRPFITMTFAARPDQRSMLGIPDGIEANDIWIYVPAGTQQMHMHVPGPRNVTLSFAGGETLTGKGPTWTANFPLAKEPRLACLNQGPVQVAFFKVSGVPAYVALTQEVAFDVQGDLKTTADPPPSDRNVAFVPGAFGKDEDRALQLNAADSLEIALGDKVSTTRRQYFEAKEGTVEFFVRLNTNPDLLGAAGLPIRVAMDSSVRNSRPWCAGFLNWEYKTSVFVNNGEETRELCRLSPARWSGHNSPAVLRPGRWYHHAVTWKLNAKGKFHGQGYLNGIPYDTGKGPNYSFWLAALKPVLPGPVLQIGRHKGSRIPRFDFALDELRVSDTMRYALDKAFQPPDAPFQTDKNTLLLFHFDGHVTGLAGTTDGRVEAKFVNKP